MSKITAEQVRDALTEWAATGAQCELFSDLLNAPAIRRLVVEACVEEMATERLSAIAPYVGSADLIAALCGPTTETPE